MGVVHPVTDQAGECGCRMTGNVALEIDLVHAVDADRTCSIPSSWSRSRARVADDIVINAAHAVVIAAIAVVDALVLRIFMGCSRIDWLV